MLPSFASPIPCRCMGASCPVPRVGSAVSPVLLEVISTSSDQVCNLNQQTHSCEPLSSPWTMLVGIGLEGSHAATRR